MGSNGKSLKSFFSSKIFTLLVMLALLVVFFGIASKGMFFLSINLRLILNSIVVASFVVTGVGYLLIFGDIDLSSGAVGTFAAVAMSTLITNVGLPWWVAFIVCIGCGMLCGLINALFINELNFQPFIATLAMSQVATGFIYVVGKGIIINIDNPVITWFGTAKLGGLIPYNNIFALLSLLIYGFILAKTKFGRKIYLCGGNRTAARLAGINPKKISYILYMNCGALSSMAAFTLACRIKSGTPQGTVSFQFSGITAALLGGVTFGGGGGSILGCFIGLLIIYVFQNGLNLLSVNSHLQTIFNGFILVIALALDMFSANRQRKAVLKAAQFSAAAKS
jgi:ribose/xylose/arabinose/galactoside ABC-type transport system permease subunit